MNTARCCPRQRQRGAAALLVVMVLFFVISLVAAYTSRNLIFEQRTASNQLRSTQALEVAEAGLEWTLSMLNHERIGPNCVARANTADTTFRQRYLNFDNIGRITPRLTAAGAELSALCVANGAGWTCSCPDASSTTPPAVAAPSTTGYWPAFRVRFQTMVFQDPLGSGVPKVPGFVRVQVVGCTRLGTGAADPCLSFTGTGDFNEGRVVLWQNIALTGGSSSPPQVALMARGNVAVGVGGAGFSAYNSLPQGSGLTVQTGGTISGTPTLVGAPGSPGGTATTIQTDSALQSAAATDPLAPLAAAVPPTGISTQDRMFAALFNMRPDAFRDQQATVLLTCPTAGCSAADVRTAASLNPGRPIWVAGDLNIDSAGDIGSATEPVLMVVTGNLQATTSGVTVFGLVYVRSASWVTGSTNLQISGATVAENDVAGNGPITFVYEPEVMRLLRWSTGSFVRVPGSWKDYQE